MELDIYIPSIKTAIEYDGEAFHGKKWGKNKLQIDQQKNDLCKRNNIRLIRVREGNLGSTGEDCIEIFREAQTNSSLNTCISEILQILKISNYDIDVERDSQEILKSIAAVKFESSLAAKCPDIIRKNWDYENNEIPPEKIPYGSRAITIYLTCDVCGQSFDSVPNRISKSPEKLCCPVCQNKKIIPGFNDAETYYKNNGIAHLIEQVDEEKNPDILKYIAPKSNKKIWWRCSVCGGSWDEKPMNRVNHPDNGCPFCSNHRLLPGYNDLETWCKNNDAMDILDMWSYEKNNPLGISPQTVLPGARQKVWFKCKNNHESFVAISSWTYGKHRCSCCAKQSRPKLKNWSAEEVDIFLKYYPIEGYTVIKRLSDKTVCQIELATKQLGIKVEESWQPWEDDIVRKEYPEFGTNIYLKLNNKSRGSVCQRAKKLGVKYLHKDGPKPKKVVCVEKLQIFNSVKEANEWCGGSTIYSAVNHGTKAKGYYWMYYDDYVKQYGEIKEQNICKL